MLLHGSLRKKLSFLLAAFFAFSYQLANPAAVPNYKTVEASVDSTVILGGQSIGVNINIDGILVLGLSDFYGSDGKKHCPAREAGLQEGDVIVAVNDKKVASSTEFSNIVDNAEGAKLDVKYKREKQNMSATIIPVKSSEDGKYRLGLWARDGTTGIGTLTFINPDTNTFGALGHGIADADTGKMISGNGNIYLSSINNIERATPTKPGELQGYFISSEIGDISVNCNCGIFGKCFDTPFTGTQIAVAKRQQISLGEAKIYCCIDGDSVQEFSVNIEKINADSKDNKSMVIRITDETLINKTGGIVQGMSGSPIIQNGKLIGAVTHVFVNDPTRGYGIFIDNMTDRM